MGVKGRAVIILDYILGWMSHSRRHRSYFCPPMTLSTSTFAVIAHPGYISPEVMVDSLSSMTKPQACFNSLA